MSFAKHAWRRVHSRFRQPFLDDLDAPGARRRAWIDMNVFDHGVFRRHWTNRHEILPGVWRGNQPAPRQIAEMARRDGIVAVINFRGVSNWGSYILEADACRRHGIALYNAPLMSRAPPPKAALLAVLDTFEAAATPLFMHCKSGADRAGLGAALYLLWAGRPPAEARAMLDERYLHFSASKTGILDRFVEAYADAHAADGIGLREWIEGPYQPRRLWDGFTPRPAATLLVDRVLRRE